MAVVGHLEYLYFARIVLETYVIPYFLLCANVVLASDEGHSRHVAAGPSTFTSSSSNKLLLQVTFRHK